MKVLDLALKKIYPSATEGDTAFIKGVLLGIFLLGFPVIFGGLVK